MTLLIDIRGGMSLDGVFPALRVGDAYYGRVTASGGTPFYTYNIVDGVLPSGLTFDTITGEVTGTPTSNKMAAITVQAKDLQGMTVERVFVIPATVLSSIVTVNSGLLWRYLQIPAAPPDTNPYPTSVPNEAMVGFDDSSWAEGYAPFGNNGTGNAAASAQSLDGNLQPAMGTIIPQFVGAWMRRTIYITTIPESGIEIHGVHDNAYSIYVNGVHVAYEYGADMTAFTAQITKDQLVSGDNTFAVWMMDQSANQIPEDWSYFDFWGQSSLT